MATPKHPRIVGNNRKRAMQSHEKARQAYELRLQGYRLDHIADQLKLDVSTVSKMIRKGLDEAKEHNKELAQRVREMDLESLSELQPIYFQKAKDGEVEGFYALMKIFERRAKLIGLDSPEKIEVENSYKGYVGIDTSKWPEVKKEMANDT